jgi:hypothetical protein
MDSLVLSSQIYRSTYLVRLDRLLTSPCLLTILIVLPCLRTYLCITSERNCHVVMVDVSQSSDPGAEYRS